MVANDINEAQTDQKEDQLLEASDVFTRAKHPVTLKVRNTYLMRLSFVVYNYFKLIL